MICGADMKKKSSFLLVLALCMAPVPLLAFNAQPVVAQEVPEQQPLWSYTIGSPVGSVAISSDGSYIAAGSWDHNVYLFSRDSSTPLWSYQTGGMDRSVSISSDGSYWTGYWGDRVCLFSRADNTPLWSYATGGPVISVSMSSDGSYIAAGSADNRVYLFSRTSGTPLWSYETGGQVFSVAISSDGSYIAAGSGDHNVYLFSRDSSTPLWSYTTGSVVEVSISSDGSYIAAGSGDHNVYLFSRTSGTPLWSYTTGDWVISVSISSDGGYIAAGSRDHKVYLFSQELSNNSSGSASPSFPWLIAIGAIVAISIIAVIALLVKRRGGREELRPEEGKEKPKVNVKMNLRVGLIAGLIAVVVIVVVFWSQGKGGGGGGPFAGEWRSPYACTYYALDSSGESWTEYTANFYLKLQQSGDEVWAEEGWVEIVSYRTVPSYSLGSDFPPLAPVPHPSQPGVYSGPIPFSGGTFRNYEYPGGYFRVTASGDTLTFKEGGMIGPTLNPVTVFTLTQGDPKFNSRDTLRVTQMTGEDTAEPNAIVLVKQ